MSKPARGWTVFWRKDRQRWALEYQRPDGSYTQKAVDRAIGPKQRKLAIAWAATWLQEQDRAGWADARHRARTGTVTVADLYPTWIELREKRSKRTDDNAISPSTVKNNKTHFARHVLPLRGSEVVADLNVPGERRFARALTDRLKTASTVRNVHSSWARFLDDVIGEGWVNLPANPAKAKAVLEELPSHRATNLPDEVVRLPADQAQALIEASSTPPGRRVRYAVAFCTGLTDGELAGLFWSDLDLEAVVPTLTVRRNCALVGPEGHATMGKTKAVQRVRVVPLHACAREALLEWRDHVWSILVMRAPTSTDIVFPGPDGAPSRVKSARHIRSDLTALGLPTSVGPRPIDFHSTRRTFASELARLEVSEEIRQRLMGHARDSVLERHYTGRSLSQLAEAVAKLPFRWVSVLPALLTGAGPGGGKPNDSARAVSSGSRIRKPLLYPLSYGGEAEKLRAIVGRRKDLHALRSRQITRAIGLRTILDDGKVPSGSHLPTGKEPARTKRTETFGEVFDAALNVTGDEMVAIIEQVIAEAGGLQ